MIKIVKGNILNATEDIICHQVNCKGIMGVGLAKQIRDKYPMVYEKYVELVNWQKKEYEKGCAKTSSLLGSIQFVNCPDGKIVVNMFGQEGYGRDKQYTDYNALRKCLSGLYGSVTAEYSTFKGMSIAIPYGIGCGLGGGKWEEVYKIIEDVFHDYGVTIYKLK